MMQAPSDTLGTVPKRSRKSWFHALLLLMLGLLLAGWMQEARTAPLPPPTPMPTVPGFQLTCLARKSAPAYIPGEVVYQVSRSSGSVTEHVHNFQALDGTISARAVVCSFEMVTFVKDKIVPAIAKFMLPIGIAVIFLAVVLFGIRLTLTGGVKAPLGEGIILVFKISIVLLILLGMQANAGPNAFNLSRIAIGAQNELLAWTDLAYNSLSNTTNGPLMRECRLMQANSINLKLPQGTSYKAGQPGTAIFADLPRAYALRNLSAFNPSTAAGRDLMTAHIDGFPIPLGVWKSVDCMLGLVIGAGAGVMVNTTLFAMFASMLSAGGLGIACFFMILTFFLTLLAMIARSVFTVMQAYIVIAMLLMFLPLVIPTIMFRKTYDYFSRYLALYIGIIFQPMLVIIFMGFAAQGISMFLIYNKDDFASFNAQAYGRRTYQTATNMVVDKKPELYSLWQIIGFDVIQEPAMRGALMDALIDNSPGKPLIGFKGMATINAWYQLKKNNVDMFQLGSNPFVMEEVLGEDGIKTTRVDIKKSKDNLAPWLENLGNAITSDGLNNARALLNAAIAKEDDPDWVNSSNEGGNVQGQPLSLPYINVKPDSPYDMFLQDTYKSNKVKYGALADERLVYDEDGNQVFDLDPKTNTMVPRKEYWGTHQWYLGGKINPEFEVWFFKKFFAAVFCLMLMVYIFFSLNQNIPEIAQGITGSAAYVLLGGGDGGAFSGIPMGEMIEGRLRGTENYWKQAFANAESKAKDPADRLGYFLGSGLEAGVKEGLDFKNTEIGGLLDDLKDNVTGQKKE